jgi:hypothetical protein
VTTHPELEIGVPRVVRDAPDMVTFRSSPQGIVEIAGDGPAPAETRVLVVLGWLGELERLSKPAP